MAVRITRTTSPPAQTLTSGAAIFTQRRPEIWWDRPSRACKISSEILRPTPGPALLGNIQTPNGLSDTSRNIVVSPVWDTCGTAGFCPAGNVPSGSATVQVIGFAAIFLEGLRGNDVIARLISISSCSTSGGGGGGAGGGGATITGGTVLSVPLRLGPHTERKGSFFFPDSK